MISIKYFWTDKSPTDEEIYEAMHLAENEDCLVIIKWKVWLSIYGFLRVIQDFIKSLSCSQKIVFMLLGF